jgi:hypothetical protein
LEDTLKREDLNVIGSASRNSVDHAALWLLQREKKRTYEPSQCGMKITGLIPLSRPTPTGATNDEQPTLAAPGSRRRLKPSPQILLS